MEGRSKENDPLNLMKLAKEGDVNAFGRIYELYFTPVYRYIYIRFKNKHEAEDLTQTVFLKAFARLDNFKDLGKTPLVYFFIIARNTITDYYRKKKEVLLDGDKDRFEKIPEEGGGPLESIEKKEVSQKVRQAINLLASEQKEVISLKFLNDLSNKEIAEVLDKSEDAVRQLQCRALKSLRKNFKGVEII